MNAAERSALWPHQVEAVDAIVAAVRGGGRTTMVAACGTGKTRIGAATVRQLPRSRRILVVLPTIELLRQTLPVYLTRATGPAPTAVAMCCDATVSQQQELHDEADQVVVSTSGQLLADVAGSRRDVTVFSTYMSLPAVAEAHRLGLAGWDVAVIDEAHRSAGHAGGPWQIVHDDQRIPSARRIYMTATPKVSKRKSTDRVSMDDPAVFGTVSYRLTFARAIELELLADYRIVVPVVTSDEVHRLAHDRNAAVLLGGRSMPAATLATQIAVLKTMVQFGARRAISYHPRVADAQAWAATFPAAARLLPGGAPEVWAGHVSGSQPSNLRQQVIGRLAAPGDHLVLVSNAKVLTEGIDVPAVDAVVFAHPRSEIDAVQAVGRALRTGGKVGKVATIVVPLMLAAGQSPQDALSGSSWEPVWQVLSALRDHDERLDTELRGRRRALADGNTPPAGRKAELPPWLTVTGVEVDADFAAAITVQAVRAITSTWDECYGAAQAFYREHGHLRIPIDHVTDGGLALGNWWHRQKQYLQTAPVGDERSQALHELGLSHQSRDEAWTANYEVLKDLFEQTGQVRPPVRSQPWTWLKTQVQQLKAGKQSDERVALLAAIGISTDNRRDIEWRQTYDLLKQFHDEHGHLNIPADLRTPAGAMVVPWIYRHATLRRNGELDDAKIALLDEIGFRWNRGQDDRQTQWETQLQEFAAFRKTHGHINVPYGALRWWFLRQSQLFDEGTLSPDRARKLAEIDPLWHDLRASLTSYRTRRNLSLTDPSWHDIRALLPVRDDPAWNATDQRAVVEAVLWKVRTRCDWDDIDLPGVSATQLKRWYGQWRKACVWDKIDDAARIRGVAQP